MKRQSTITEKRNTARARVLKGVISFHHLCATISCTVRNLSETGACLLVTSPLGIPDEFEWCLIGTRSRAVAQVAWRSTDRIDVEFL
jgi:hypothetical protein